MKTTNWDAVIASAPLNTDAAKARDGGGVGWTPEVRREEDFVRSHAPIKIRAIVWHQTWSDLAGLKVGKLTVIGCADLPGRSKKRPAAWVVRCVCGYYETRIAKTLRDPEYAPRAACSECMYLDDLKTGRTQRPTVAERTRGRG